MTQQREEKQKDIPISTVIMGGIVLLLIFALVIGYIVKKNTYSNPLHCQDSFDTDINMTLKPVAQKIYASPNCYDYKQEGSQYIISCCRDKGAKYKHEKIFS